MIQQFLYHQSLNSRASLAPSTHVTNSVPHLCCSNDDSFTTQTQCDQKGSGMLSIKKMPKGKANPRHMESMPTSLHYTSTCHFGGLQNWQNEQSITTVPHVSMFLIKHSNQCPRSFLDTKIQSQNHYISSQIIMEIGQEFSKSTTSNMV